MDYLTAAVIERAKCMNAALKTNSAMRASDFWDELNEDNLHNIENGGILNFKRSVSQNYFNFYIASTAESQFGALARSWAAAPDDYPLVVELQGHLEMDIRRSVVTPTPTQEKVYTFFVGLLWSLAVKGDTNGLANKLAEPALGNPVRITLPDGRLVSQDLANSFREWQRIAPYTQGMATENPVIAEIGAGYGRFGWTCLQAMPCRYWDFDIAPALAISEFYLSHTYPDKKIFRWQPWQNWEAVAAEVLSADIAFFSIDQLALIPNDLIDFFVSISCLHEMRKEQFELALAMMCEKTKHAIYTKNWTRFHNVADQFVFSSDMLTPSDKWKIEYSRVDDVLLDMTEKLFTRNA